MTASRQRLGRRAENMVARRLESAGWELVERNARTRTGEIDLIALDGATLVFVEVKAARAGSPTGPVRPAHQVGPRKRARIRLLAREWLGAGASPSGVAGYRFDVVGVLVGPDGVEIDHIRNAF
ncbi:MAG: YraN family protein [Solirubrobacterales bacterium]|nr:YraN family protein [Solirubrobacterales bacterium]